MKTYSKPYIYIYKLLHNYSGKSSKARFFKDRFLSTVLILLATIYLTSCFGGNIKPSSTAEFMKTLRTELTSVGFTCHSPKDIISELDCYHKQTYETNIHYYFKSRRLRFMALFNTTNACPDIEDLILRYNWSVKAAQASCRDKTLAFSTNILIPESGLGGQEIRRYLIWWTDMLNKSMKKSGMWDNVQ